ncbi:hypothetical protein CWB41_15230 [Methylovirgula ligni]|uniref:Dolichyl-phosphate-mannose-protein mannosyltransferase n=1 Tax=Methylovirgula ligni TaxID=569860 RepID=A0A3D9YZE7_9HYPH|nr:hypothetical protein [Methylovirgula ligni]QAY96919.1 hypothetical protein CWB41_15230 [Methylovirgula ligni]REF88027.1 hypothetical protein DES32_1668 [Methylovirgula ligni]
MPHSTQSGASAGRRAILTGGEVVALLVVLMAVLKLVAVWFFVPAARTTFDLGFGFDPYVRSLVAGRGYVSCGSGSCDVASRMPGLPLFLAALAPLTTSLRIVDAIKVLLLSLLVYLAVRGIDRRLAVRHCWQVGIYIALGLFLVLSPNLIKHASAAYYEEGYVLELLAITAVCLFFVAVAPREASAGRYVAAIAAASVCYLFKSSLILVWGAVALLIVVFALTSGRRALAAGLVAVALIAPAGWLAHNAIESHRLSFMSSTDGENMYRGWNTYTLVLYPHCSLDMLFDPVTTCEGEAITSPHEPGRAGFKTEWAWNDAYKTRATEWIRQNPGAALKTFAVKAYEVLLSPQLVPYRNYVPAPDGSHLIELPRSRGEADVGSLWLALGRLIEIFAFGASLYLLIRGDSAARRVALASLALGVCYATPYILGFGYERHFSILIMLAALSSLFLVSALVRLSGAKAAA